MESKFGRGFVVNLVLLSKHFALPPEQAFFGAADHLMEMQVPPRMKGTEVAELTERLRKLILWHKVGINDSQDAEAIKKLIKRLIFAVDRDLGIDDPDMGSFD
jgi:hypothetical protein